jgi:DNA-binding HxlR family transcriptional regulator
VRAKKDRTRIASACPADRILRLLWREWTTHVIWLLGDAGKLSFGELNRRLAGISRKVLTQRLRRMEADGLIERRAHDDGSRRVLYGLTDMGRDIDRALRALGPVVEHWQEPPPAVTS